MFSPIRSSLSQCRSPRACCLNSKSWAALVWGQTCGRIESSRIQNHGRETLQTDGQTEQHYAKPHGSILLLHWSCTHDIACPLPWPKCGCICPVRECGNGIKIAYPTSRELQARSKPVQGSERWILIRQTTVTRLGYLEKFDRIWYGRIMLNWCGSLFGSLKLWPPGFKYTRGASCWSHSSCHLCVKYMMTYHLPTSSLHLTSIAPHCRITKTVSHHATFYYYYFQFCSWTPLQSPQALHSVPFPCTSFFDMS